MALTIRQFCKVFLVTVVIGGAIGLPTTAYARNHLGSGAWDPGGGDFRWLYGGLCDCRYGTYENCGLRRRVFIDQWGYRLVRWICY
jgi:hypothetical protein